MTLLIAWGLVAEPIEDPADLLRRVIALGIRATPSRIAGRVI